MYKKHFLFLIQEIYKPLPTYIMIQESCDDFHPHLGKKNLFTSYANNVTDQTCRLVDLLGVVGAHTGLKSVS